MVGNKMRERARKDENRQVFFVFAGLWVRRHHPAAAYPLVLFEQTDPRLPLILLSVL
jgi:hypothetical protein